MPTPKLSDEVLREAVDAVAQYGTPSEAAKALGIADSTLRHRLMAASREGYAPGHFESGVAPGYLMGKVTVQRAGGVVERTWERQSPDQVEFQRAIKSGITAFMRDQEPIARPSAPPKSRNQDIIPWVQIGDAHLGMLAHEAETGANFDLKIAKREMLAGVYGLIDQSEPTERLVINDLGDFTHYENMRGETDASGHKLDFDGRFPKMIDVYAETMRSIMDKALSKAQTVDVIVNQGNHSRTNDIWMAVLLREVYGHTGRVNVLNNHSKFIAYRMGNTFVLTHHSDKCKPAKLGHVMATDYAIDWGETRYRYIDIGHIHHNMVLKEHPGVVLESWNQLANKDLWSGDNGYRSRQAISIVERSRTYGEQRRRILPIEQIRDGIEAACILRGDAIPYRPTPLMAFAA